MEGTGQGGRITVGDVEKAAGETSSQRNAGYPGDLPETGREAQGQEIPRGRASLPCRGDRCPGGGPHGTRTGLREVEQLRRVSTLKTPSGPVGVFPFLDVTVTELLASVRRVVLLHGVQDPGNVGTAIRSAHAFGAGVALSRGSADLYNPKTVRATMGSIFHALVARELESVDFLAEASAAGFGLVAAVPEAGDTPRVSARGQARSLYRR